MSRATPPVCSPEATSAPSRNTAMESVSAPPGSAATSTDTDRSKAFTRAVARAVPIPVIASGGVGTLEHFAEGVIEGEADAVLAASVFHFGTFSIRQVKEYMASQGIPVRLDF